MDPRSVVVNLWHACYSGLLLKVLKGTLSLSKEKTIGMTILICQLR